MALEWQLCLLHICYLELNFFSEIKKVVANSGET
jgi:hypothetical protein